MADAVGLEGRGFNVAQSLWTLVLFLGLTKARLGFFHDGMETQGDSFGFASGITRKSYHQTSSSLVGLLAFFPCSTARIPLPLATSGAEPGK